MHDPTEHARQITITKAQLDLLADAIRTAIASRTEAVWCADCDKAFPASCCQQHLDYLAEAEEYASLAQSLGIELDS